MTTPCPHEVICAVTTRSYTAPPRQFFSALSTYSLSATAAGMWTILFSMPGDKEITAAGIKEFCSDDEETIAAALRELVDVGYIGLDHLLGADGITVQTKYTVYATPEQNPAFAVKGGEVAPS